MPLAITVRHVFSLAHVLKGASSCYKDKLFGLHFLYERRPYLDENPYLTDPVPHTPRQNANHQALLAQHPGEDATGQCT